MDRGTEATLTRTVPGSIVKSYTKDLSLPVCGTFVSASSALGLFRVRESLQWYGLGLLKSLYGRLYTVVGKAATSLLSSMDSGLEAFSRNPTHGSFSALTFPSTEMTNYVNQRFLSYWIGLLSQRHFISRVKLTCLTTV